MTINGVPKAFLRLMSFVLEPWEPSLFSVLAVWALCPPSRSGFLCFFFEDPPPPPPATPGLTPLPHHPALPF